MKCKAEGCHKILRSDNKSGYCKKHSSFGNRLPEKYCLECGRKLRSSTNTNGYCRKHRYMSEAYKKTMKKATVKCSELHPDRGKIANAKFYKNNPEKCKETHFKWRQKNPDKLVALMRKFRRENPKAAKAIATRGALRRRARKRDAIGNFTKDEIDLLIIDSTECYYCGAKLNGKYHIDHKTPLSKGGSNFISNMAVTCPTCNLKKNTKTEKEFMIQL